MKCLEGYDGLTQKEADLLFEKEGMNKEQCMEIASEYLQLFFSHPTQAQKFYMKHEAEIDLVFQWHERSKKDLENERFRKMMIKKEEEFCEECGEPMADHDDGDCPKKFLEL